MAKENTIVRLQPKPNQTCINPGAEAMEPALTPGASTPAHDHNPGERLRHRINRDLQLQDAAREGNG
ncbi:UNVERIFIED_CONTAM: hypothetical protein FKN15_044247 [Acipenser sinensis]